MIETIRNEGYYHHIIGKAKLVFQSQKVCIISSKGLNQRGPS